MVCGRGTQSILWARGRWLAWSSGPSTSPLERMPRLRISAVVGLALALVPPVAHADVGLPLAAVFLPPMWLAFVPIVLVEALVLVRLLGIPFGRAVPPALVGNLASTLIGIPLVWLVLAILELICCGAARGLSTFGARLYAVTIQAPWLIPYEDEFSWMVPSALIVMAIPCFAASVLIEAPVNRLFLRDASNRSVWRATAAANAASYVVLAVIFWPTWKLAGHMGRFFNPLLEWLMETTFKVVGALLRGH